MRDKKVETFLERGKYKWTYVDHVAFTDIDIVASKENPARLMRKVDDDRAESYALQMQDKIEFPAIVLLNLDLEAVKKWIIATGVHRLTAAECVKGKTGLDAYCVIEADAYRREVLFRQLNTLEGAGVPIHEQVLQVLELHYKHNITLKQLAKEWHLKEAQLSYAKADRQAKDRGMRLGEYNFLQLKTPQKAYHALNRIASDVTYKEATHIAVHYKLPPTDIETMVKEIKTTKSEADADVVIKQHRDAAIQQMEQQKARHGRLPPATANKMLGVGKQFLKYMEKGIDHLYLSAVNNPEQAMQILQAVADAAKEVKLELERIQRTMHHDDANVVNLRG